jgi:hypothetical protein
MPATPVMPNYGGTSAGNGYGMSYVGGFSNLPNGIQNAGQGANNAYTGTVTPDETVANNLTGLLASNNPYITLARQSGMDAANDRGLLNSGIAAGNSQRAAIQASLPIAQQDAQTAATLQGTNLNNLNQVLATRMNNLSSETNARTAAGASMYNARLGLTNSRENRTFEGQQAGLGRSFQDYMAQQGFGNQMRMASFNLGGQLLQGSQNFNNNLFLQASSNPFMMNDPEALSGFASFANSGMDGYYNDLFGYAGNGGGDLPQWQENNQWYQTPDYSQEYGDGNYAGGSPQLPYFQQPDTYPNYNGNGGY